MYIQIGLLFTEKTMGTHISFRVNDEFQDTLDFLVKKTGENKTSLLLKGLKELKKRVLYKTDLTEEQNTRKNPWADIAGILGPMSDKEADDFVQSIRDARVENDWDEIENLFKDMNN